MGRPEAMIIELVHTCFRVRVGREEGNGWVYVLRSPNRRRRAQYCGMPASSTYFTSKSVNQSIISVGGSRNTEPFFRAWNRATLYTPRLARIETKAL